MKVKPAAPPPIFHMQNKKSDFHADDRCHGNPFLCVKCVAMLHRVLQGAPAFRGISYAEPIGQYILPFLRSSFAAWVDKWG